MVVILVCKADEPTGNLDKDTENVCKQVDTVYELKKGK